MEENAGAAHVVIVNDLMVGRLFHGADLIGRTLAVDNGPYQVIGVPLSRTASCSAASARWASCPIQTLIRNFDVNQDEAGFTVKPRDGVARDIAIDDLIGALRGARGLGPRTVDDFDILAPDRVFQLYNQIFGVFFLVMLVLSIRWG